jgi:hypothetical protein
MAHDVVCGYQRLDIFHVEVDRSRQVPIGVRGLDAQAAASGASGRALMTGDGTDLRLRTNAEMPAT